MRKRVYGIETEYGYTGPPNLTFYEWLPNGSRLYMDGDHPEYCTPECSSPREVVRYDKAGETIVQSVFNQGRFFKNNVTKNANPEKIGIPVSFGCHENYLMDPLPFEEIIWPLIPFLVTRQLYSGGGGGLSYSGQYFISPRAMQMRELHAESSMEQSRAIVCTKEEPLADPARFRRLHLVLGEPNMSEIAGSKENLSPS